MAESLPYVLVIGTLKKVLDKIKAASTPDRFTQDYLAETLGMKGGTARSVIPFLKKAGFLAADSSPTDIYKRFRNPAASGLAAAEALKKAYAPVFAMNENAHRLTDAELRGLMTQATGLDHDSRVLQAIVASFRQIKSLASFDAQPPTSLAIPAADPKEKKEGVPSDARETSDLPVGMNLSYTINLNLPATPDINVFNAIFRSLKENLLKR